MRAFSRRRQRQMFYAGRLRLNSDLLAARAQLKLDTVSETVGASRPVGECAGRGTSGRYVRVYLCATVTIITITEKDGFGEKIVYLFGYIYFKRL